MAVVLLAAKHVQDGLCHGQAWLDGRDAQLSLVGLGAIGVGGDGGDARQPCQKRERHIDLMLGIGGIRVLIEGVEQQRGSLEHIHDGAGGRGAREERQVASGQRPARVDARVVVCQLSRRRQLAGEQEIGKLLVTKAILGVGRLHQLAYGVAAEDEVALIGMDAGLVFGIAVHVADGGKASHHARSIVVSKTALHAIVAVKLWVDGIDGEKALVKPVAHWRAPQRDGGHGAHVHNMEQG